MSRSASWDGLIMGKRTAGRSNRTYVSMWRLMLSSPLKTKKKTIQFYLTLGVSICLDVISIEISISTPKKYQSWRSRKSWQFQKVSLDDQEISVEIEISRFSLDINVQTKKSRSISRNSSRSENFGVSRQFVSISIEKCMDFVFSRRDFSTNLDCVSTNLDKSRQSRQISTISTKISTRQSLDWKVSILKISISIGLDCRDPQG
jgi:hypothetical protein